MDDLYPGWDGLAAGADRLVDEILLPRSRGREARWRSHDWGTGGPGPWHDMPPDVPLLVEGCGCLSARSAPLAGLRLWLDAPEPVRRRRFSRRDHGAFDDHWADWERLAAVFAARHRSLSLADLRLDRSAPG